jgi:hypothetical protein
MPNACLTQHTFSHLATRFFNKSEGKAASYETTQSARRVCWNSWIAPHNLEGFFLNMGDMLVKSGDWQTAQQIYANAKHLHSYASWKFADLLEARIEQAQENVTAFNGVPGAPVRPIMIDSEFACTACHQR